jgi:hypothetical protein
MDTVNVAALVTLLNFTQIMVKLIAETDFLTLS